MKTEDGPLYRAAELKIRDVKRIRAVALTLPPGTTTIAGRNAQGKSSILDSIAAAIGGGAAQPERPIRDGAERGAIRLTLDAIGDGEPRHVLVERRYERAAGDETGERFTTHLIVRFDGESAKRPQGALDALRGATIDPRAWSDPPGLSKPEARDRARLKMMVGGIGGDFDLDEHAKARERLADRRLRAGQDARAAEAHAEKLAEEVEDVPEAPDPAALEAARERGRNAKAAVSEWGLRERERERIGRDAVALSDDAERELRESKHKVLTAKERVRDLENALALARGELEGARRRHENAEAARLAATSKEEAARLALASERETDPRPDPAAEIAEATRAEDDYHVAANAHQAARLAKAAAEDAKTAAAAKREAWARLDAEVANMDLELAERVASLRMPDGVEVTPELRVHVGGVPIDQASAAERLRASVGVCAALCGRLRLLWVHDGALLDADSRAALAAAAEEKGVQLIVETVEPTEGAVVIEDGRLAEKDEE